MKITVPFSMNRAVEEESIGGFELKIKTVQSNTYLATLQCNVVSNPTEFEEAMAIHVVTFTWILDKNNKNKIRYGQYLKVQLAYQGFTDDVPAQYYTGYFSTVATVKYTSKPAVYIEDLTNEISGYRRSYTGIYETSEDKSERPYSYIFNLYDRQKKLIESSEWLLHNSDNNVTTTTSKAVEKTVDVYTFSSQLIANREYFIEYGVRTINNLIIYSKLYVCMQIEAINPEIHADLFADNCYDEGYIKLTLRAAAGYSPYTSGAYVISRADERDGYTGWQVLRNVYFTNSQNFEEWDFKDFTIEQGIRYVYCIQQFNDNSIYSSKKYANYKDNAELDDIAVFADFEDMFLYDGKKQLKIKFNPKVSSFKTNLMEAKIDTIGSKFPFIFRNGSVEYKEFPIAGLISYLSDNANLFIDYEEDLKLISPELRRSKTPAPQISEYNSPTTSSVGYNFQAERTFKLRVMNWLNNGSVKLFRSPSEGNYLIRLMNITLTPEDRVNRLVHSFSATAYEMGDLTYDNLVAFGIINVNPLEEEFTGYDTVKIYELVKGMWEFEQSYVKINKFPIYEWLEIYAPAGTKIHIGSPSNDNVIEISQSNFFSLQDSSVFLQDLYLVYSDFLDEEGKIKTNLLDGTVSYHYSARASLPAEFSSLSNVTIKNEIKTLIGPVAQQNNPFAIEYTDNKITKQILQFLALEFFNRPIVEIVWANGKYYLKNTSTEMNFFDPLTIYKLSLVYYQSSLNDNQSLTSIGTSLNYQITLKPKGEEAIVFNEIPTINIPFKDYEYITFGNGIGLNCAYQVRYNTYKEG